VIIIFVRRKSFQRSPFGDNIKDISLPMVNPFLVIFPLNSVSKPPMRHDADNSDLKENTLQQGSTVADKNDAVEDTNAEEEKCVIHETSTTLR